MLVDSGAFLGAAGVAFAGVIGLSEDRFGDEVHNMMKTVDCVSGTVT